MRLLSASLPVYPRWYLLLVSFIVLSHAKKQSNDDCLCTLIPRPDPSEKALTARWIVHSLDWGVLSTISSLSDTATDLPDNTPFGNVYSFVDGPCHRGTGVPYLYGTYMDQSFHDTLSNSQVSLAVSEASMCSGNLLQDCRLGTKYGDPESPVCARVTLMGRLVAVDKQEEEYEMAMEALFERHPSMADWPEDHEWVIMKMDIHQVWLIDYYGGATILTSEQYFGASLAENYVGPDILQTEKL
mmetsp:Transcript_29739/g.65471  ORF Transcript_29739/g.65471 Transcript_29739/m.65471 type:complete len:243 (+) Transcript_29739:178-906(+)